MDPTAQHLAWRAQLGPQGPFLPRADPLGAEFARAMDLNGTDLRIARGTVVDSIAYLHAYRVHLEHLGPPLLCSFATHTACLPMGARSLETLPPGAAVIVAWRERSGLGTILAAEPPLGVDPALALCDWIAMAGRCGMAIDPAHQALFQGRETGWPANYAAGRPRDSTTAGEWGAIFETGARVAADSFLVQLAIDEATGVFAFYHDQLLRVAGVNFQAFSAAHAFTAGDDEGECHLERGWSPFPWEEQGALQAGAAYARDVPTGQSQGSAPWYAAREPIFDDQAPFHRRVFWGGYPGQGGKDLVQAPPAWPPAVSGAGPPPPPVQRLTAPPEAAYDAAGLIEEQRTLAGSWALRGAKSVHIMKQSAVPAPRRLRAAEDAAGDSPANYRPAGLGGNGPPHKAPADVETTTDVPGQNVAALYDGVAQLRNWQGEHGFAYHALDWRVPEETDSPLCPRGAAPADLGALAERDSLPPPPPVSLAVGGAHGDVKYFPNEAGLHLLDDGSVVLRDGFGSAIVMTGGRIYLDPASDLMVRAGRSAIVWAGRDISLRARKCAEMSASTGDLRLKAERNLHALAGNSGAGGLLLESRGADAYTYKNVVGDQTVSGGVQVKSAGSFVAWANGHYLRSLNGGPIVLDADQGAGPIVTWSDTMTRYLAGAALDAFGPPAKATAANRFTAQGAVMAGALSCGGGATFAGGVLAAGDVTAIDGGFASNQAPAAGGQVGGFAPGGDRPARRALASAAAGGASAAASASEFYADAIAPNWYADGQAGDPALIALAGFSFRTTEQYQTAGLSCWETAWQQYGRLSGSSLAPWNEPPVSSGTISTRPWPGDAAWARGGAFLTQDLALYDVAAGAAAPRGKNQAAYEAPRYKAPATSPFDGHYMVIDTPAPGAAPAGGASPSP